MNTELKEKLISEIHKIKNVSAHDKGNYVRITNPYKGVSAFNVGEKLDAIALRFGLTRSRVRTFGNGMICVANWEDRIF